MLIKQVSLISMTHLFSLPAFYMPIAVRRSVVWTRRSRKYGFFEEGQLLSVSKHIAPAH